MESFSKIIHTTALPFRPAPPPVQALTAAFVKCPYRKWFCITIHVDEFSTEKSLSPTAVFCLHRVVFFTTFLQHCEVISCWNFLQNNKILKKMKKRTGVSKVHAISHCAKYRDGNPRGRVAPTSHTTILEVLRIIRGRKLQPVWLISHSS